MDQRMAGESKRSSFRCEVCVWVVCGCVVCVWVHMCVLCVCVCGWSVGGVWVWCVGGGGVRYTW